MSSNQPSINRCQLAQWGRQDSSTKYVVEGRGAGRVSGKDGQNSARSTKKIFRLPTLVFSLPTLPYVTVAHPAHRTDADLREKASLATNQEGPLPSPPSDLALQLGLVIHTPGL